MAEGWRPVRSLTKFERSFLSKNQTIIHYTNMASTLSLTPCSPSSCIYGQWPLYQSCSTLTFTDDNGPYMVSPQYRKPPPSPRAPTGGRSIKLGDGRMVIIGRMVSVTPSPRSSQTILTAQTPSICRKFIKIFGCK